MNIDAEQDEVELSSLRCRGSYFSWPDGADDISWLAVDQIIRVLDNPDIDARGHYVFKL